MNIMQMKYFCIFTYQNGKKINYILIFVNVHE